MYWILALITLKKYWCTRCLRILCGKMYYSFSRKKLHVGIRVYLYFFFVKYASSALFLNPWLGWMWYFSLDSVPISRNFFFCEIEKNKSKGEQQNSFSWKVRSSFFFFSNSFFSHKFQFCHGKSFYCKTSSQSFTDLLLLTFLKNAFGFSDQVSHFCSVTNSISKQLQIQDEKHSEIDSEFVQKNIEKKGNKPFLEKFTGVILYLF